MNAIVCVDKNWGIGRNGKLLFSIPEDMQNFVLNTSYKPVVMGLNTLRSLPGGKPLKNRLNIVIAPEDEELPKGVVHVINIKELSDYLTKNDLVDKAMVIGGGMVYNTLFPFCDYVFVTKVDVDGNADTFVRDLTNLDEGFVFFYGTAPRRVEVKDADGNTHTASLQYIVYKNLRINS